MFLFSLLDKLSYIIIDFKTICNFLLCILLTEHLLNTVNTKYGSGVGINGAPVLEHHLEFTQLMIFTTK